MRYVLLISLVILLGEAVAVWVRLDRMEDQMDQHHKALVKALDHRDQLIRDLQQKAHQ